VVDGYEPDRAGPTFGALLRNQTVLLEGGAVQFDCSRCPWKLKISGAVVEDIIDRAARAQAKTAKVDEQSIARSRERIALREIIRELWCSMEPGVPLPASVRPIDFQPRLERSVSARHPASLG
jgi:hypothetical protein